MKSKRRQRVLLVIFSGLTIAYGATWLLGIRAVKAAHSEELLSFYKKQELLYSEQKVNLENNVFWKDMLEKYGGFPTWQEYQAWHAREKDDRYFAVLPFL